MKILSLNIPNDDNNEIIVQGRKNKGNVVLIFNYLFTIQSFIILCSNVPTNCATSL